MTVFLLVLTMIKGRCIVVFGRGAPFSSSTFLFLFTKFLNAICYREIFNTQHKTFRNIHAYILFEQGRHAIVHEQHVIFVLINNLLVKLVLVVVQFFVEFLLIFQLFPSIKCK